MTIKPQPELLKFLYSLNPSAEADLETMAQHLVVKAFKSGEVMIEQGETTDKCYFILKGMVRKFAVDADGNETTYGFYNEMQSVVVYYQNDNPKPSPYSYVCIEDTLSIVGDPESALAVASACPELMSMSKVVLDRTIDEVQDTLASYIKMTPEQRVKHVADTRPELLTRVPQHQLASYLGITPESLSRIKKRLGLTASEKPKGK